MRRPGNRPGATLALLAASLAVAAGLGEIAARMVLPAPLPWLYPQVRYRPDPALVFALAPDQQAFTADKPVAINSRGLRGPIVPYERTPGRLRILFLGDSITFGYGVTDDETFASRVRALLAERGESVEAIHVGVPAWNTEQEIAYLEDEGLRYRPDVVVMGVCWNDIGTKSGVRVSPDGWLYEHTDAATPPPSPGDAQGHSGVRNFLKKSRLLYAARSAWRTVGSALRPDATSSLRADVLEGRDTPRVADGWNDVATAVHRLRELADQHGFQTLIVAFPIPLTLERAYPNRSYPARLKGIAEAEGLPFLDLEDAFRRHFHGHESLFIAYDGDHPNAAGHDVAAREVVKVLAQPHMFARSQARP